MVCFVFIQVLFPPNVLKRVLLQLSQAKREDKKREGAQEEDHCQPM